MTFKMPNDNKFTENDRLLPQWRKAFEVVELLSAFTKNQITKLIALADLPEVAPEDVVEATLSLIDGEVVNEQDVPFQIKLAQGLKVAPDGETISEVPRIVFPPVANWHRPSVTGVTSSTTNLTTSFPRLYAQAFRLTSPSTITNLGCYLGSSGTFAVGLHHASGVNGDGGPGVSIYSSGSFSGVAGYMPAVNIPLDKGVYWVLIACGTAGALLRQVATMDTCGAELGFVEVGGNFYPIHGLYRDIVGVEILADETDSVWTAAYTGTPFPFLMMT